jgi:AcrR family transcriptional regulator
MATTPRRPYAARLPPEQRREQLLDAALNLIVHEGYDNVSMESVARGAGVTKPVVYDLFANVGELLRALFVREEERALAALAAALPDIDSDVDPDDLFTGGIRAFLSAVAERPQAWALILKPSEATPAAMRAEVERRRADLLAQVESVVAWGVKKRGGPAGLDVELAARAILALGEDSARLVLADPSRFAPERMADFVDWLLQGLARA